MDLTIEKPTIHSDSRGIVFEPLDVTALQQQKNAHVVLTYPGRIRGNHYHRHSTETLVIMGPAFLRVRNEGKLKDIEVPSGVVYRVIIPPGVSHAIYNSGDRPNFLVAFNSAPHHREAPDVVQDILIEQENGMPVRKAPQL